MILLKLFYVFFNIGLFAFGGGYAIVALAYNEFVKKRKWLTKNEFFDFYALSQTLPGIISVNFAAFIGNKKGRFWGGCCAVLGMILPAVLIILIVADFVVEIERYKSLSHALVGVQLAVSVMILNMVLKQGKESLKTKKGLFIGIITSGWVLFGLTPVIPLIISGVCGYIYYIKKKKVFE